MSNVARVQSVSERSPAPDTTDKLEVMDEVGRKLSIAYDPETGELRATYGHVTWTLIFEALEEYIRVVVENFGPQAAVKQSKKRGKRTKKPQLDEMRRMTVDANTERPLEPGSETTAPDPT